MVDSTSFVDSDGNIKAAKLASTFVNSYLLTFFGGLIGFIIAFLKLPADFINDALTWVGSTIGILVSQPKDSLDLAWEEAELAFPIAGPLDFAIGVLLIMVFFAAVNWMIGRVREGI